MPQIYSEHSILCLTSKFESFGLVTVEAQACGCIPVVHNAGGVAVTLADGQTGFLYSPNTPQKLAETIIKAIWAVDTAPSIRQKAVDFVRDNFGMTRAADYISKLWDRITIARQINNVRALLESDDIEQAGLECEQLLQKYPGHPDMLLLQAMIMLQRADALKANATIRKVFEKFPNHTRALNDYGLTAMKTGDIKKAAEYFGRAYKLNPWDKNTNINCYTVLKKSGRYEQAETILSNYLENVGEEARMLQLLGEIDGFTRGQGSAVNVVSQQLLDSRQTVHCQDSASEPLVTVIMPAYNSADYIGQAIQSVLIQSYPKLELLIVDDGSTDNTREIILQNKDERIKYFHKENGGPSSARNLAISKASGQYIMPLDADDMMTPDFIAKHLQEFDKHPDADLVYSDVLLIDADGNPIKVMNKPEYQGRRNLIRDLFRCGHPVIPFRLGIRRSVFDKIGLYDETLMIAEDYDMMRRFVKAGLKEHHLREPLHIRRMRPDSISITADADKTKNHFDVLRRFTDTFSGEELFPDIEWDKIPPQARQLHAKCQAAATCLLLGQAYVKARSDCLKMDPANQQVQHLLQKCEDARAGHVEAAQQGVC
jgi:tetratricopeptide (TPR) repeat protein